MKKIISSIALIVLIFASKKTELPVQTDKEIAMVSSSAKGGDTSPTVITTVVKNLLIFLKVPILKTGRNTCFLKPIFLT